MRPYTLLKAPFGSVGFVASAAGLSHVHLMKSPLVRVAESMKRRYPDGRRDDDLLPGLQEDLRLYFAGRPVSFSVRLDLAGFSAFQQRVLRACSRIEYGETLSYGQLARRAGCPQGARAVGGVMARNPVPLVIPCHRVVGSGGALGGFSAEHGVSLKKYLLALESRALVPA